MSGTGPNRLVDSREPGWVAGVKRGWALVFLRDGIRYCATRSTCSA